MFARWAPHDAPTYLGERRIRSYQWYFLDRQKARHFENAGLL